MGTDTDYIKDGDLRMFCKAANIPALTVHTLDYKPQGHGLPTQMPTSVAADGFECLFMLDSSHQVLSFFHDWVQAIVNYDTSNGLFAPNGRDPEQLPYEIGYKSDYGMTMRVRMFSTHDPLSYYTCVLTGVFPTHVGAVEMSWENNDGYAILPVSFAFSEIKMSGTKVGPIQSYVARGLGLLEFIQSVGSTVQTFQSLRKPQNIQDGINEFTSVVYGVTQPFAKLKSFMQLF